MLHKWRAVWRFHKPSGDRRCESRGIRVGGSKYTFRNGTTVYLGWRSKLSSAVDKVVRNLDRNVSEGEKASPVRVVPAALVQD